MFEFPLILPCLHRGEWYLSFCALYNKKNNKFGNSSIMITLAEQIEKSYSTVLGKEKFTAIIGCKCEWKVAGSTAKFAHFSNKEIAKKYKVSLCTEDYEKASEDLKAEVFIHFEQVQAKASTKQQRGS